MFGEPYDLKDNHSRAGVLISLVGAMILILFVGDPFRALILSQVFLSIQLPFTVFMQIYLTSSKNVMGKYANSTYLKTILVTIAAIITFLNLKLLYELFVH
jgi:manganese transport protein